jgi:hypothetical protein
MSICIQKLHIRYKKRNLMRLDNERESSNVEDLRDSSGGFAGGMRGMPSIVTLMFI